MNGKPFFDTNVLVYTVAKGDPRSEVALELLESGGSVSVHVLNEFVAVARRKLGMSWKDVLAALELIGELCPSPASITLRTHAKALEIAQRYNYRIYDALVVAAALEASAAVLYSEDLSDGQVIEGLTIVNPFRSSNRISPQR